MEDRLFHYMYKCRLCGEVFPCTQREESNALRDMGNAASGKKCKFDIMIHSCGDCYGLADFVGVKADV